MFGLWVRFENWWLDWQYRKVLGSIPPAKIGSGYLNEAQWRALYGNRPWPGTPEQQMASYEAFQRAKRQATASH